MMIVRILTENDNRQVALEFALRAKVDGDQLIFLSLQFYAPINYLLIKLLLIKIRNPPY